MSQHYPGATAAKIRTLHAKYLILNPFPSGDDAAHATIASPPGRSLGRLPWEEDMRVSPSGSGRSPSKTIDAAVRVEEWRN